MSQLLHTTSLHNHTFCLSPLSSVIPLPVNGMRWKNDIKFCAVLKLNHASESSEGFTHIPTCTLTGRRILQIKVGVQEFVCLKLPRCLWCEPGLKNNSLLNSRANYTAAAPKEGFYKGTQIISQNSRSLEKTRELPPPSQTHAANCSSLSKATFGYKYLFTPLITTM